MTRTAARTLLDAAVSEKDFQATVVRLAKLNGWLVYHTHDARRSEPGFPDLVMVRDGVLVFAELKRQGRQPTAAQWVWLRALQDVEEVAAVWWVPSVWPHIEALLTAPRAGRHRGGGGGRGEA